MADARRRAKAAKRDTRRGQGALRREQAAIELKVR